MTADTPSTSGEGVDVLRILRGVNIERPLFNDCMTYRYNYENHDSAIARIAELLAAIEDEMSPEAMDYPYTRIAAAYRACRATQGAHP